MALLSPEDYYLFPIVFEARWSACTHCKMRDERKGIGDRLVQCPYCLNTRTSINGVDLPPWLLTLISDQDHYIYDSENNWMNASAHVDTRFGKIDFFVWIRQHHPDGWLYFLNKGISLDTIFQQVLKGKYQIYDLSGVPIAQWDNDDLTYYDAAQPYIAKRERLA